MKIWNVPLSAADITEKEKRAVAAAVESGWVGPVGKDVTLFEREIAEFVGVKHSVALSSGTAALHLALKSIGVGAGDAVITSTMTFVATANAIRYVGAEPIFVDVAEDGNLSVPALEEAIALVAEKGFRLGAILPVDLYGRPADYANILPIASRWGVPVIADAAESFGAAHGGAKAGSFGDGAVFSFNANKILTTGGGGMFLSEDEDKVSNIRYLSSQAKSPAAHYQHEEVGYNYRLSNVLAALGRAQLKRFPDMQARRREIRDQYSTFFAGKAAISMLLDDADEDNCWLTSILVSPEATWKAADLATHLGNAGIESRPLWKPMHMQPLFQDAYFVGGSMAEQLFAQGLTLPSGSGLSDHQVKNVMAEISWFLDRV